MSDRLTPQERGLLREAFEAFDTNGSWTLTGGEIHAIFRLLGLGELSPEDRDRWFRRLDRKHDWVLDFEEFVRLYMELRAQNTLTLEAAVAVCAKRPFERTPEELYRLANYLSATVPFFSYLSRPMLDQLCHTVGVAQYKPGQWLWEQQWDERSSGGALDEVHCVLEGAVSLWQHPAILRKAQTFAQRSATLRSMQSVGHSGLSASHSMARPPGLQNVDTSHSDSTPPSPTGAGTLTGAARAPSPVVSSASPLEQARVRNLSAARGALSQRWPGADGAGSAPGSPKAVGGRSVKLEKALTRSATTRKAGLRFQLPEQNAAAPLSNDTSASAAGPSAASKPASLASRFRTAARAVSMLQKVVTEKAQAQSVGQEGVHTGPHGPRQWLEHGAKSLAKRFGEDYDAYSEAGEDDEDARRQESSRKARLLWRKVYLAIKFFRRAAQAGSAMGTSGGKRQQVPRATATVIAALSADGCCSDIADIEHMPLSVIAALHEVAEQLDTPDSDDDDLDADRQHPLQAATQAQPMSRVAAALAHSESRRFDTRSMAGSDNSDTPDSDNDSSDAESCVSAGAASVHSRVSRVSRVSAKSTKSTGARSVRSVAGAGTLKGALKLTVDIPRTPKKLTVQLSPAAGPEADSPAGAQSIRSIHSRATSFRRAVSIAKRPHDSPVFVGFCKAGSWLNEQALLPVLDAPGPKAMRVGALAASFVTVVTVSRGAFAAAMSACTGALGSGPSPQPTNPYQSQSQGVFSVERLMWLADKPPHTRTVCDEAVLTHYLSQVPSFKALPQELRFKLSRAVLPQGYRRGELIIRQGDMPHAMYVIVGGSVGVFRNPDGPVSGGRAGITGPRTTERMGPQPGSQQALSLSGAGSAQSVAGAGGSGRSLHHQVTLSSAGVRRTQAASRRVSIAGARGSMSGADPATQLTFSKPTSSHAQAQSSHAQVQSSHDSGAVPPPAMAVASAAPQPCDSHSVVDVSDGTTPAGGVTSAAPAVELPSLPISRLHHASLPSAADSPQFSAVEAAQPDLAPTPQPLMTADQPALHSSRRASHCGAAAPPRNASPASSRRASMAGTPDAPLSTETLAALIAEGAATISPAGVPGLSSQSRRTSTAGDASTPDVPMPPRRLSMTGASIRRRSMTGVAAEGSRALAGPSRFAASRKEPRQSDCGELILSGPLDLTPPRRQSMSGGAAGNTAVTCNQPSSTSGAVPGAAKGGSAGGAVAGGARGSRTLVPNLSRLSASVHERRAVMASEKVSAAAAMRSKHAAARNSSGPGAVGLTEEHASAASKVAALMLGDKAAENRTTGPVNNASQIQELESSLGPLQQLLGPSKALGEQELINLPRSAAHNSSPTTFVPETYLRRRETSALALQECQLLQIEVHVYRECLMEWRRRELAQRLAFLQTLGCCKTLKQQALMSVDNSLHWMEVPRGTVLQFRGTPMQGLLFIQKGVVGVYHGPARATAQHVLEQYSAAVARLQAGDEEWAMEQTVSRDTMVTRRPQVSMAGHSLITSQSLMSRADTVRFTATGQISLDGRDRTVSVAGSQVPSKRVSLIGMSTRMTQRPSTSGLATQRSMLHTQRSMLQTQRSMLQTQRSMLPSRMSTPGFGRTSQSGALQHTLTRKAGATAGGRDRAGSTSSTVPELPSNGPAGTLFGAHTPLRLVGLMGANDFAGEDGLLNGMHTVTLMAETEVKFALLRAADMTILEESGIRRLLTLAQQRQDARSSQAEKGPDQWPVTANRTGEALYGQAATPQGKVAGHHRAWVEAGSGLAAALTALSGSTWVSAQPAAQRPEVVSILGGSGSTQAGSQGSVTDLSLYRKWFDAAQRNAAQQALQAELAGVSTSPVPTDPRSPRRGPPCQHAALPFGSETHRAPSPTPVTKQLADSACSDAACGHSLHPAPPPPREIIDTVLAGTTKPSAGPPVPPGPPKTDTSGAPMCTTQRRALDIVCAARSQLVQGLQKAPIHVVQSELPVLPRPAQLLQVLQRGLDTDSSADHTGTHPVCTSSTLHSDAIECPDGQDAAPGPQDSRPVPDVPDTTSGAPDDSHTGDAAPDTTLTPTDDGAGGATAPQTAALDDPDSIVPMRVHLPAGTQSFTECEVNLSTGSPVQGGEVSDSLASDPQQPMERNVLPEGEAEAQALLEPEANGVRLPFHRQRIVWHEDVHHPDGSNSLEHGTPEAPSQPWSPPSRSALKAQAALSHPHQDLLVSHFSVASSAATARQRRQQSHTALHAAPMLHRPETIVTATGCLELCAALIPGVLARTVAGVGDPDVMDTRCSSEVFQGRDAVRRIRAAKPQWQVGQLQAKLHRAALNHVLQTAHVDKASQCGATQDLISLRPHTTVTPGSHAVGLSRLQAQGNVSLLYAHARKQGPLVQGSLNSGMHFSTAAVTSPRWHDLESAKDHRPPHATPFIPRDVSVGQANSKTAAALLGVAW